MKKILLDTNGYSHFLNGDKAILEEIVDSQRVYMSVFVLGELMTGFKGGTKERKNLELLNEFLSKNSVEVLDAGYETSQLFSEIKIELKNIGKPIPINDVWIAAHVRESGSKLITYDQHFKSILGLSIWTNL